MSRDIIVRLSRAEGEALRLLAERSATTWEDAKGVLAPQSIHAGFRALAKLADSLK